MNENRLIQTLIDLKISTKESLKLFHPRTRDAEDLEVLKCQNSGVIVLSEVRTDSYYYEKNKEYSSEENITNTSENIITTKALDDDQRRFQSYGLLHRRSLACKKIGR